MSNVLTTYIGPYLWSESPRQIVDGQALICVAVGALTPPCHIWVPNATDGAPRPLPWTDKYEEDAGVEPFTSETIAADCAWFRERFREEIATIGGKVSWGVVKWWT